MYTAVCLSNDTKTRSGFSTIEDAETYIKTRVCPACTLTLDAGQETYQYDGINDTYPVEDVLMTPCGAEWLLLSEVEYLLYLDDDFPFTTENGEDNGRH